MQRQNNSLENMLLDVIVEIRSMCEIAKAAADRSGEDFDKGRQFAIYEIMSLLDSQVDVFGIDRAAIGLDKFSSRDFIREE